MWGNIIDVVFLDLMFCICIKVVIVFDVCFGIWFGWVICCVFLYFKGIDIEFDIWFCGFNCLVDLFDKLVYVILLLVINIGKSVFFVLFILSVIRKFLFGYFIRVKIIIYMNGIDIIMFYYFFNIFDDKIFCFRNVWMIIKLVFISGNLVWMLFCWVIFR